MPPIPKNGFMKQTPVITCPVLMRLAAGRAVGPAERAAPGRCSPADGVAAAAVAGLELQYTQVCQTWQHDVETVHLLPAGLYTHSAASTSGGVPGDRHQLSVAQSTAA